MGFIWDAKPRRITETDFEVTEMTRMKEWFMGFINSNEVGLWLLVFLAGGTRVVLDHKDPKWWRIVAEGIFIATVTVLCGRTLPFFGLPPELSSGIGALFSFFGAKWVQIKLKKQAEHALEKYSDKNMP